MNPALAVLTVTIILMVRAAIKYQRELNRDIYKHSHDPTLMVSRSESETLEKDRKHQ
jgi:hypothetical protein